MNPQTDTIDTNPSPAPFAQIAPSLDYAGPRHPPGNAPEYPRILREANALAVCSWVCWLVGGTDLVDEPLTDRIAACVWVEVRDDGTSATLLDKRGYFGMLAVDPAQQGKGLGRLLVQTAETHCRAAGLMVQKIPEQLEVVDAMPRNATMKILKYELRDRFAG